jgi:hypothetical protein
MPLWMIRCTYPVSKALSSGKRTGAVFCFNSRPESGGSPRDILLHQKPAGAPHGTRAAGGPVPHKLERVHRLKRVLGVRLPRRASCQPHHRIGPRL